MKCEDCRYWGQEHGYVPGPRAALVKTARRCSLHSQDGDVFMSDSDHLGDLERLSAPWARHHALSAGAAFEQSVLLTLPEFGCLQFERQPILSVATIISAIHSLPRYIAAVFYSRDIEDWRPRVLFEDGAQYSLYSFEAMGLSVLMKGAPTQPLRDLRFRQASETPGSVGDFVTSALIHEERNRCALLQFKEGSWKMLSGGMVSFLKKNLLRDDVYELVRGRDVPGHESG